MTSAEWSAIAAGIQALAAVGQLIATVMLVKLTGKYVLETHRLVDETKRQVSMGHELANEQKRPRLVISAAGYTSGPNDISGKINIQNTGPGAAYDIHVRSNAIPGSPIWWGLNALGAGENIQQWGFGFDKAVVGNPLQGGLWQKVIIEVLYKDGDGHLYISRLAGGQYEYLGEVSKQ